MVVDVTERTRAEQARQQQHQQLVNAQEEERRRISRELHDSLGQHLTALHLGLKSIQTQDGCPISVADEIQQMRELALQIDAEVERLSFELRPPALDDLGLADALHRHIQQWSATSGIVVDLHLRGLDHERLPSFVETTLYRIVQEALTNVVKHAGVARVSLIIERRRAEVIAIIEDNGRGFDLAAAEAAPRRFGLKSMAERAVLAGGRLDIETAPGSGTTIYIHIPLQTDQDEGG
jgi:signal transduction histidine kinase